MCWAGDSGDFRSDPRAWADQPRLRRRQDDHGRHGPRDDGHRHRRRERTARWTPQAGHLEPAARGASVEGARGVIINVTGGPDLLAHRSERGVVHHPAGRARRGEHHLRGGDRRLAAGAREDHGDRHGLRPCRVVAVAGRVAEPDAGRSSRLHDAAARGADDRRRRHVARRLARRPSLDLPATMAAGAEDQAVRDEAASPLDVPAFLRRQSE